MSEQLLLASGSRYKSILLERLKIPFDTIDADVDENPQENEAPAALAARLAESKARAGLRDHPAKLVIGADQVASSAGMPLIGKPGTVEANRHQLHMLSGKEVRFFTAVSVLASNHEAPTTFVDTTVVQFRTLSAQMINAYVDAEPAHDCAGGCKVEGLGIALLERVHSEDPTALIGLPLIALSQMLRDHGLSVP